MDTASTALTPAELFVNSLQQWQEIDATDYEGSWFQAVVVLRTSSHVRVHFVGWERRWCENIPIEDAKGRLRERRDDTRVGQEGAQTVEDVMALYRCGGGGGGGGGAWWNVIVLQEPQGLEPIHLLCFNRRAR